MRKEQKIYLNDHEKLIKKNLLTVVGFTIESSLFVVKNLNEYEFARALFRIKRYYADTDEDKKVLDILITKCILSTKDITKKFEEMNDDPEFIDKLTRSLKNNKNDKSMVLSRKAGKHCKKYSTENKKIREDIKKKSFF